MRHADHLIELHGRLEQGLLRSIRSACVGIFPPLHVLKDGIGRGTAEIRDGGCKIFRLVRRRAKAVEHARDELWRRSIEIDLAAFVLNQNAGHTLLRHRAKNHRPARPKMQRSSVAASNTEGQVEQALRRVLASTTALIVAHRPSTVLLADRVALLVDGRIAAVGTHSELLDTVPEYRRLLAQTSELEEVGHD